jgi:ATP-binding cassette subfamily B protein
VILGALGFVLAFCNAQVLQTFVNWCVALMQETAGTLPATADGLQVPGGSPWAVQLFQGLGISTLFSATVVALVLYSAVLLSNAAIGYVRARLMGNFQITSQSDIERAVLRNLLRKDDQFFQNHSASEVANRLSGDIRQIIDRRRNVEQIWTAATMVAGALFWFIVNGGIILTAVGFGIIVAGVSIGFFVAGGMKRLTRAQAGADDDVKSKVEDFLMTTPEVQVSNLHEEVVERFTKVQDGRRSSFLELIDLGGRLSVVYGFSQMATFSGFFITMLVLAFTDLSDAGRLASMIPVVIQQLPMLYGGVRTMAETWMRIHLAQPSVERLLEYDCPPQRKPPPPGVKAVEAIPALEGAPEITLKKMNYRFSPDGPLQGGSDGITLNAAARSFNALVGGSGSGKSTLCQLILARIQPEAGEIKIGDVPVTQMSAEMRAKLVAYMPQTNVLLDTTIGDNILFGHPEAKEGIESLSKEEMSLLDRVGVSRLAISKALEMVPDKDDAKEFDGAAIAEIRTQLRERIATQLKTEVLTLGPGRAAMHHPALYHILGGSAATAPFLALSTSKAGDEQLGQLSKAEEAKALVALGASVLASTQELLSRFRDVGSYNRVAPVPLDADVFELRTQLAGIPASAAQAEGPRRKLLVVGLLASPSETKPAPAGPSGQSLPPLPTDPNSSFVKQVAKIAGNTIVPFEAEKINTQLSWRDNLLFGSATNINRRMQAEVDRIILEGIAETPFKRQLTNSGFAYPVGRQGRKLSGGQRQMVCLGRTLMRDVGIYILDEPTAALDPQNRNRVNTFLKELGENATIIAITHDPELAKHADQVLMMSAGRMHATGTYAELIEQNEEFRTVIGSAQGH